MTKTRTKWALDRAGMNMKVRPQDDFFHYANGGWLKNNPIPPAESRWGTFIALRYKVDRQLRAILTELDARKNLAKGSADQIIRDFYRSGMDMKRRNALDLQPLEPYLRRVRNASDKAEIEKHIAELHRIGCAVFWDSGVDIDSKNSERYVFHFAQGGLGMPDRDYYLKDDVESRRVKQAYTSHVEALFQLMGRDVHDAKKQAAALLALETALAKASMTKEDRRDPHKTYHKMSVAQLAKLSPGIDWKSYLERIGVKKPHSLIVMQPQFYAATTRLFKATTLEDLKNYMEWHIVNDFSYLLSSRFVNQSFSFYGKVMAGTTKMKPLWRRVLNTINCLVDELLGQIYVRKHFPPEAKRRMKILVDDLLAVFEERLKSLHWMGAATKKKALRKLKTFIPKIGYPDKWRSYRGLVITPDDYVGNVIRSALCDHRHEIKKLRLKKRNRYEWFMSPQTVNAYYWSSGNEIVFPAAILQPPFFDLAADDANNYGAIGAVIGHEITHGFDDKGSEFDALGNLKSWWTSADRKRFSAKAAVVRRQFDAYTVAGGIKVNGQLTLGENIADLGGLSVAYAAYQRRLSHTEREDIAGYTPEQRFFLGFALFEREHSRPEFEKMHTLTDPHSPGRYRINGPLSNFEPFYKTYGVKKGDKLYRAPKDREMVW